MAQPLDIHLATHDERRHAHRNVHDVWNRGLPVERHVARREQAPHHNFAIWIVGCEDGQVVTSLACHPFEFSLRGERTPGIGIASVHTVPTARGKGHAPRLIEWTERWALEHGRTLSLLFSDVDPDYYARMGYVRCASWEGFRDCQQAATAADRGYRLAPCSAGTSLAELAALYDRFVAGRPLAVHRYIGYWQNLLARRPHDLFQWVIDPQQRRVGYLRFSPIPEPLFVTDPIGRPTGWKLSDYALDSPGDELFDAALRLAIDWAAEQGSEKIGGWLPDTPVTRSLFELHPRTTEITMFKALAALVDWTPELLAVADRLCEIDHV